MLSADYMAIILRGNLGGTGGIVPPNN